MHSLISFKLFASCLRMVNIRENILDYFHDKYVTRIITLLRLYEYCLNNAKCCLQSEKDLFAYVLVSLNCH